MPTLWINAGELSGDLQGAALLRALRALRPDLKAVGMGGPNLSRAGQRNILHIEQLSVMGIVEVLTALPRAFRMLQQIRHTMQRLRPLAVILVDAPEFNFRVAKIAKELGIPVYYFIPPKVWAWRTGRVHFLKENIRHLFSILPFEPAFYQQHAISVDYVGNPLVEMVNYPELAALTPDLSVVGLMPGSRKGEIERLMPLFGETARKLLAEGRKLTFHCLRAPNMTEERLRALWPAAIPVTFLPPENRYRAMRKCGMILAASGTATLETALAGVPTVVAYKVAPLSAWVGRHMIQVPWVSLPNLIMKREVFPERLQDAATPETLAAALTNWLDHPEQRASVCSDLAELRERCGAPGSATRAAELLLEKLNIPDTK